MPLLARHLLIGFQDRDDLIPVRPDPVHGLVCRGALWGAGAKDLALSESTCGTFTRLQDPNAKRG